MKGSRFKIAGVAALALLFVLGAGCKEIGARRDIQEGNKAYAASDYEGAVKLYQGALEVQPDLAIGWYNLGLSHLALFAPGLKTPDNEAHAQGAIDAFNKYLTMEPTDTVARNYMLSTCIDSGHYDIAIKYFQDKLAIDPNNKEAIANLAQIYTSAANYDEAIKWLSKRAEIEDKPDGKADAWYTIGVLSWKRLYQHPEVTGTERVRIADQGIGWLQKADAARKGHQGTLSYLNLLYRERAAAHGDSYARAVDTASAQVYFKMATDLNKKP